MPMSSFQVFSLVILLCSAVFNLLSQPLWLNVNTLLASRYDWIPPDGDPPTLRLLLLTAHPDDECLFFAPTVLALLTQPLAPRPEVFSLCLSAGDADGLGGIRREELERSLDVLGIEEGHRWIVDRPDLKDNISMHWDSQAIADAVKPYIIQHRIDVILTFDRHGVSLHPNHMSLPQGAAHLIASLTSPEQRVVLPRFFTLVSVPLLQKYTGALAALTAKAKFMLAGMVRGFERDPDTPSELPPTTLQSPVQEVLSPTAEREGDITVGGQSLPKFVSGAAEYKTALRAMMQHRSQLVWFRWLYVAFSRYMWVNEWVEVDPATYTNIKQSASARNTCE